MIFTLALLHLYIVAGSQDSTCQDDPAGSMLQTAVASGSVETLETSVQKDLLVENQTAWSCITKDTTWQDNGSRRRGGGKTYYLDRHRVDCGTEMVLKRWQFFNGGSNMKIEYECCTPPGGVKRVDGVKYTGNKGGDEQSFDSMILLDGVDCGSDFIQGWKLIRSGGNVIEYWCGRPTWAVGSYCPSTSGYGSDDGPGYGEIVYLDRQVWTSCGRYGGSYGMTYWDIVRTDSAAGAHVRMPMRCCGLVAPTPAPTPAPTADPTPEPTPEPTPAPTEAPTTAPTLPQADDVPAPSPSEPLLCTTCELKFNQLKAENNPFDASVNQFATLAAGKVMTFTKACSYMGMDLDLVINFASDYTGKQSMSKVVGDMYELNVKQNTAVTLDMSLVKSGTSEVVPNVPTIFSVLDVDKHGAAIQTVTTDGYEEFKKGAKVNKVGKVFTSLREGTAADNPTNPMVLSSDAEASTVSFKYIGSWQVKLAIGGTAEYGRSFFLAGATQLMSACPLPGDTLTDPVEIDPFATPPHGKAGYAF